MLHGGGGLEPEQVAGFDSWAAWLKGLGIASIIVDSYRGRGLSQFHYDGNQTKFMDMLDQRANDVQRTIAWLSTTDWADSRRILIFGESQGGMTAAVLALKTPLRIPQIALYAPCSFLLLQEPAISKDFPPSLWLLGEKDTVARAKQCVDFRARFAELGGNVASIEIVVFPNAYHTYDWDVPGRRWGTHWLEYNKDATKETLNKSPAALS